MIKLLLKQKYCHLNNSHPFHKFTIKSSKKYTQQLLPLLTFPQTNQYNDLSISYLLDWKQNLRIVCNKQKIKQLKKLMMNKMMSGAGKCYQKCFRVHSTTKHERQSIYNSFQKINKNRKIKKFSDEKKYSPFNTQSRQSRHSYLLRVTCQPNMKTNYQVNYSPVQKKNRVSTIDRAAFQRIIGPVNITDYQDHRTNKPIPRCSLSLTQTTKPKPLIPSDIQKWKNTHSNLDFTKQLTPCRFAHNPQTKSSFDANTLKLLQQTTQSNFNNYNRFSLTTKASKSHDFKSNSGHQFLANIFGKDTAPEYNLLNSKEDKVKKAMRGPKGELRFYLYRNQIKTRIDRADPNWLQCLDYTIDLRNPDKTRNNSAIDFELMPKRATNEVHSRYPIRQALRNEVPNNKIR